MSFDARPTDFSAARISEVVQEILGAGILPPIVQAGHPVLRHVAAPFEGQLSDAELGHLIDPDVAAIRGREPLPFFAMLNPSYRALGDKSVAFYEGCLSIGGLQAAVLRPESVQLDFAAPDGTQLERTFTGWQARIVQHETDHLHGVLFLDRAELRSISNNAEYSARWAQPDISRARQELGFLPDPAED